MTSVEIGHTGKVGSNNGYEKFSCRCPQCSEAHELRMEQRRQRLGITKRVFPDFEHGTLGRYDSPRFKCRCDECREANAARKREYTGAEPRIKGTRPRAERRAEEPKQLRKTAPTLKIKGGITPVRTFELTPVTDCGEELSNGHFCRRLFPCQIHPIGP